MGLVAILIPWFLITTIGLPYDGLVAMGAGAVTVYLFRWFLLWLVVAYNSMGELRQRVRQTWANVDVQIKRRTDLIPALVQVAQGLRGHEHDVEVQLAQLRNQMVATAPGQPGPDPAACAPALRVLVAHYPALTADHVFSTLSTTLEDCEERIALANAYHNDIATFMDTRQETFLGGVFRALGSFRLQPLLDAMSFGRSATFEPPALVIEVSRKPTG